MILETYKFTLPVEFFDDLLTIELDAKEVFDVEVDQGVVNYPDGSWETCEQYWNRLSEIAQLRLIKESIDERINKHTERTKSAKG